MTRGLQVYALDTRIFLRMVGQGDSNLRCLTCGTPVWDLLGHVLVSKPRNGGRVRRCLDCAVRSCVLCSNVTPELDIADEEDG